MCLVCFHCILLLQNPHSSITVSGVNVILTRVLLGPLQAGCMHSNGEDQTGAAGQLYLVWQEEEAIQRQVSGQAQCR